MRIEWAMALPVVLSMGCVSTSVREDRTLVRELASVSAELAEVDQPVDDASPDEVAPLLAEPVDDNTAVRIALLNNRELRAQLRELGIARARLLGASMLPNPLLEAELQPERQTSVELRVEWNIAGLLLAPLRSEAASADLDRARLEVAGAVIDLGYRVRVGFYDLQMAAEILRITQRSLEALGAAREAAHALQEAGNMRALDVAARDAAYEEERVRVAEAELELVLAREHMQRLLGLHGEETTWTLAGTLPNAPSEEADVEGIERRAIEASLELRALRAQMLGAARRAGLARVEGMLPEVLVDVHMLVGGSSADTQIGGGLAVRLPLFDRGDAEVAAYEHTLDAAFERYVGMAIDVRSQARETRARVLSAGSRVRQYEQVILPARRHVLDETLLQYNAMQVSIFSLLSALRERQMREVDAVRTRREYACALAGMEALLAGHHVRVGGVAQSASSTTSEGAH
jgi:cobalt-zinc-cadmium efflux system outer membrane protein